MGEFDDVLAMEPGDEWDDYVPSDDPRALVELAPLAAVLRLPNARVHLRGEVPAVVLDAFVDLTDDDLELWDEAPLVTLTVDVFDGAATIVDLERGELGGGASDTELLDSLVAALAQLAISTDPMRLHLEAASVEIDTRGAGSLGVVLVERDCADRHGLVSELLRNGARYLSADQTILLPGSRTTFASPGPLAGGGADPGAPSWVAASTLGAVCHFTRSRAVVFVRRSEGASTSLEPVSTAEGCARLLREGLGVERFGPAALDVVATLASEASFWELTHDHLVEAALKVQQLPAPAGRQLTTMMRFDRDDRVGASDATSEETESPAAVRRGRSSLRVARFDLGGVLCDGETGRVLVITDDEADAIEQLLPGAPASDLDGALARIRDAGVELFTEQIRRFNTRAGSELAGIESFGLPNSPRGRLATAAWSEDARRLAGSTWLTPESSPPAAIAQAVLRSVVELPDDLRAGFVELHTQSRARVEQSEGVLIGVLEQIEAAGIVPLVLGTAVGAHDGLLPAEFTDEDRIDLLLDKEGIESASRCLTSTGFVPVPQRMGIGSGGPIAELIEPSTSVSIRLHTQLSVGPFGELVDHDELHGRSVPFALGPVWSRALHPEDRFVLACVLIDPSDRGVPGQDERNVVLSAPRAEPLMAEVLEASERWGATRSVLAAIRSVDEVLPGLSPWLVERARRYDEPVKRRRKGLLRRRSR